MRYKGEIRYVRYYTPGAAARKVRTASPEKPRPAEMPRASQPVQQPAARQKKAGALVVEPFAMVGTAVAVVLVILVAVGCFRLYQTQTREAAMADYIATLSAENEALDKQYHSGYDPEEVRKTAEALGLVPKDQVKHIHVEVHQPVPEPEPTFWESFWAEVRELFA